jgi:DNA sulfur modification protein DndE
MDHYTLTPLSRWGKGPPNRNRDSQNEPLVLDESKNWNTQLTALSITDYFNRLNALLVANPPYPADAAVVERFAQLGIGAGKTFDLNAFSPAVRDAIVEFGRTDIPETVKRIASRGMPEKVRPIIGRYGTDYQERYLMIFGGLGQNFQEDAVYIWLNQDLQGNKLDGNQRYVVRFEPGQLPPARAFWSVTLYDKNFFLAKDMPMDRHVLNNNSGMKLGTDGSMEIYLQADSPGADKESNWLPVPRDEFFAILGIYWGEERLFNGQWKEPPVRLVR